MTSLLIPKQAPESLATPNYDVVFADAGAEMYRTRNIGWTSLGMNRFQYVIGRPFSAQPMEGIATLQLQSVRVQYERTDGDMRPWLHPDDFETPPVWLKATMNAPQDLTLGESFATPIGNAGRQIQVHFPRVPLETVPEADVYQAVEILQAITTALREAQ